jgi:hypothetical protein
MQELSQKAAAGRKEKSRRGSIKIARKAAKARWRKPKVKEIANGSGAGAGSELAGFAGAQGLEGRVSEPQSTGQATRGCPRQWNAAWQ